LIGAVEGRPDALLNGARDLLRRRKQLTRSRRKPECASEANEEEKTGEDPDEHGKKERWEKETRDISPRRKMEAKDRAERRFSSVGERDGTAITPSVEDRCARDCLDYREGIVARRASRPSRSEYSEATWGIRYQ
jgi:hypothetical protein